MVFIIKIIAFLWVIVLSAGLISGINRSEPLDDGVKAMLVCDFISIIVILALILG